MSKLDRLDWILIFFSVLLVSIIRILNISQKNLWFDEIYSWNMATDSVASLINRTSYDIHPPLYYLILKLWINFTGDSVIAMRFLSVIFCTLSVYFIYRLSIPLLNRKGTAIVIIFYVFSPLNIYYSQEVRMAAMNLFLNLASVYYFYLLTGTGHLSRKNIISYLVFTVAAIYTHYFSFLIIAGQIFFLLINYRRFKPFARQFMVMLSVIMITYLPWIPIVIRQIIKGQSWRKPGNLSSLMGEYLNYILDMNLGLYYHYINLTLLRYLSVIIVLLILLPFVTFFFRKKRESSIFLFISVSLVSLILAGMIYISQKIEFYRYLSIIIPYLLLLIVYSYYNFPEKLRYFCLLILFAINIYGVYIYFSFDFKNNDYRDMVIRIINDYKEGDRIYTEPHYYAWIANYYFKEKKTFITAVNTDYGFNEIMDSISIQKPDRAWFILDYSVSDTSEYSLYKKRIFEYYDSLYSKRYDLAPTKAELFLLKRK